MISEMAREDAERLAKEGVSLSFEDCVHLNALGLKVERGERANGERLRRVAFLGDVVFHELTIGHELWLEEVTRTVDVSDPVSALVVKAYAAATALHALPPSSDARLLKRRIDKWARRIRNQTLEDVAGAVIYAVDGGSRQGIGGGGAPPSRAAIKSSIMTGVLCQGVAVEIGTIGEIAEMTSSELELVARYKARMKGIKDESDRSAALGRYMQMIATIADTQKTTTRKAMQNKENSTDSTGDISGRPLATASAGVQKKDMTTL